MKSITKHINEKLVLNHSRVKQYEYEYKPKDKDELKGIIYDILNKHGNDTSKDKSVINLNIIDTSLITNMGYLFYEQEDFTDRIDISDWNVSNVKTMNSMFAYSEFNQDISKWDVSNVRDMMSMFEYCPFNQDISNWDVSNVENMAGMFYHSPFNNDISAWDVSSVTNMNSMFAHANFFNQDISRWDVSNVESMYNMFFKAKKFNQDLTPWKNKIKSADDLKAIKDYIK